MGSQPNRQCHPILKKSVVFSGPSRRQDRWKGGVEPEAQLTQPYTACFCVGRKEKKFTLSCGETWTLHAHSLQSATRSLVSTGTSQMLYDISCQVKW